MKTFTNALRIAIVLAALVPFAAAYADDTAKQPVTPTPTEAPLHEVGATATVTPTPTAAPTGRHYHDDDENRVRINGSAYVGPKESIDENAVAVNGDLTVDGNVSGNGVAVFGSATINGMVDGNSVAVLGPSTINGTVHGNAVAVMGNLTLGPHARVDGNAVSVGGNVIKDPTATVGGQIVPVYFGVNPDSPEASSLWKHSIMRGRPLAFGPHLLFFWIINLFVVAIYLLLALIFPNGVRRCADTLEHRPGITFLTGFLAMLGMPVLFILLCVTVIGIPVALVVAMAGGFAVLGAMCAVLSVLGEALLRHKTENPYVHMAVGCTLFVALSAIPYVGGLVVAAVMLAGVGVLVATRGAGFFAKKNGNGGGRTAYRSAEGV
jgi:cytoskeletal protein CcmA (bactofilin family)